MTWELGDIAECIDASWGRDLPVRALIAAPQLGQKLMVTKVISDPTPCGNCGRVHGDIYLGFPTSKVDLWLSTHFRKVQPGGEDAKVRQTEKVDA